MKVGIVGAGLQGRRRAQALKAVDDSELVIVADVRQDAAAALAANAGCVATSQWEDVVARDDVEAVIVCTPPHLHAEIGIAAMKMRKHVLCEKPLARTVAEAEEMVRVGHEQGVTLKCGFNLRHHPGIRQAREWLDCNTIGEIMFIRSRYGIGGRPGYEQEWRAKPEISGGGQLMDQGMHVLDLCRWFLGEFAEVAAFLATHFWDIAPLEDNAFVILRTQRGQIASIHVSWTQWRPLFSFEIFGTEGYIRVEGLGGAYGTERVALGRRNFSAPFSEEVIEFRGEDTSWRQEWLEFVAAIAERRNPLADGREGLEALRLAEAVYEAATAGTVVSLKASQEKTRW